MGESKRRKLLDPNYGTQKLLIGDRVFDLIDSPNVHAMVLGKVPNDDVLTKEWEAYLPFTSSNGQNKGIVIFARNFTKFKVLAFQGNGLNDFKRMFGLDWQEIGKQVSKKAEKILNTSFVIAYSD